MSRHAAGRPSGRPASFGAGLPGPRRGQMPVMNRSDYLATLPADGKRVLRKLREAIRAAAPGATEGMSSACTR